MPVSRIDVHHHVLPEFYKEAQRAVGITGTAYRGFPQWTPERSLALMDANKITTSIMSCCCITDVFVIERFPFIPTTTSKRIGR